MSITFDAFLDTLPMAAKGMGGILIVTVVIIGVMVLLNRVFSGKKTPPDDPS